MTDELKKPDRKIDGWMVASGVAIALLFWFAVANSGSVVVHFWVTTVHAPLIVVIVASAILGALVVGLWHRARPHR
jgi:uncharacterized integral membrane protein